MSIIVCVVSVYLCNRSGFIKNFLLSSTALAEIISVKEVHGVKCYYVHYVDCKYNETCLRWKELRVYVNNHLTKCTTF